MTDEQWEKIRPFVDAEAKARMAYEGWGSTNVNQPTERERIEVKLGFEHATLELIQASNNLRAALKEAGL